MKTQIRYLVHAFILCWLISDFLGAVLAQSPTCANNDQLVINTSTKTYQCITPGALPAGSGTTMIVANASSTGTTVNRLAKLTGAPSTAVITATTDTENAIGIVTSGAGTTGNATITILGQASCEFDGATTAGNYFTISATTAGKCHDAGSSFPTSGATYGRVLSTNGGAGTYVVEIMTPDIAFQNAGNGKSKPGTPNLSYQYNNGNVFTGGILTQPSGTQISLNAAGNSFRGFSGGPTITFNSLEIITDGSTTFRAPNFLTNGSDTGMGSNYGGTGSGITLKNIGGLTWQNASTVTSNGVVGFRATTSGNVMVNVTNGQDPFFIGSPGDSRDISWRHSIAYGTAPTIASGFGTGSSITGRDEAFRVTLGTTPGTGGVVTFGVAYTNAPVCTANDETTLTVVLTTTPTTTNVTITAVTGVLVNADKIGVICRGYL